MLFVFFSIHYVYVISVLFSNFHSMTTRIVERRYPDGDIQYIIQRKFLWVFWMDISDDYGYERYKTLEEAQKNRVWFEKDPEDKVV